MQKQQLAFWKVIVTDLGEDMPVLKKRVIFDRFSGATSENTMCRG
jgi:hypothetical protein